MQSNASIFSRRQMLAHTTRALALAGLSTQFAPLFAAPEKRTFKIGACEWSLRKGDPSSFEVAKEIGLDGVQVNMGSAGNDMHLRKPEVQKAYLEASRRTGVAVASLAMGELNNVPLKSDPRAKAWLMDAIEVAKALGVQVILIAQFYKGELKDDKPGIDRTVDILKEAAPKAEKQNLILGIENYLSAEENLDIVQRVGSKAVQVYYDVGNSTDKGYDIYKEIRLLKGQICEFHAKDAQFLLGQGRVDFKKVRAAMDEIGYRGWIQIEAAAPTNLVKDYQTQLKFLKGMFPA
jgi:sugar phosphate isomerase/epimerase